MEEMTKFELNKIYKTAYYEDYKNNEDLAT